MNEFLNQWSIRAICTYGQTAPLRTESIVAAEEGEPRVVIEFRCAGPAAPTGWRVCQMTLKASRQEWHSAFRPPRLRPRRPRRDLPRTARPPVAGPSARTRAGIPAGAA